MNSSTMGPDPTTGGAFTIESACPGPPATPTRAKELELQKLELEVRGLRTDRRLKWATFIATLVGAAGLVFGLAYDRFKVVDERREQQRSARVARMGAIGDASFAQIKTTSELLDRIGDRPVLLDVAMGTLEDQLKELKALTPQEVVVLQLVTATRSALNKSGRDAREWIDAIAVQSAWRAHESGPTADFAIWFGDDLKPDWAKVHNAAIAAVDTAFYRERVDQRMDEFHAASEAFLKKLYERVKRESDR